MPLVSVQDSIARVFGAKEQIAPARTPREAPDEVACTGDVGGLGDVERRTNAERLVEAVDDCSKVLSEVEIAVRLPQT